MTRAFTTSLSHAAMARIIAAAPLAVQSAPSAQEQQTQGAAGGRGGGRGGWGAAVGGVER